MRPILTLVLLLAACTTTGTVGVEEDPVEDNRPDFDGDGIPDDEDPDDDNDGIPDDEDPEGSVTVDDDGDGYSEVLGDCNDDNAAINPDAPDLVGDTIDQNCDGMDGTDWDRDHYASVLSGGDDCDDYEYFINPGVEDVWYDGVDSDCDGRNDYDQDEDGYELGADDCDDLEPKANIAHPEWAEDDIDNDCDGTVDEFSLDITTWDSHDMEITIDGGDPNGHELGMIVYEDDGNPDTNNVQEDCVSGICHVLGFEGGALEVVGYWDVAPNQTFIDGGFRPTVTFVLRFNTTGNCITWGHDPIYYTAEGCVELDPTL